MQAHGNSLEHKGDGYCVVSKSKFDLPPTQEDSCFHCQSLWLSIVVRIFSRLAREKKEVHAQIQDSVWDLLFILGPMSLNDDSVYVPSEKSFREIAGLFRMAPRGHVQTLTPCTWERRQASCRCVRRGKCRSMKLRVLETEQTSSPNVNITAYIQPRGASRSNSTFQER